ncbi:DUF2188 domain-containing protein [Sphingomonas sp. PL-96]|uniref:DUF2188 domain-containing protein n=1 Tax=Sphingomonas sp. PL-96 TaxID=2887201 RepID=UPI001E3CB4EA|nr:DUF2188 domain-containing protein [Sphingomonas sp. PL-96]MCC2977969.1 DUF2188 domain-containing protein [Sphingomonas sp. PL-96]
MARAIYYVLKSGTGWKVRHSETDYEYPTQAAAMKAAVDAANSSGKKGHDAQVLVQGHDGKWQTEWTYGHDPYPPKG